MNTIPTILDIAATAKLLGRSESAVRSLVERKVIPFRKLGRRTVILREELLDWIDKAPGVRPAEVQAVKSQRKATPEVISA